MTWLEIVSFVYNLEDEQINAILGEIVKGDSKLKRLEMPYEKQVCLQDPDIRRQAEEKIGVAEDVSLDDMGSDLLRQADQKMGDVEVGYRFYHPIFALSEGPSLSSAQMMEEMFRLRLKWS